LIRDGESEGRSGDGGGWNEALAKQPPDAAPSHHHEQNRQCDYSCKRCNDCCERKDIHNAIPQCEKHDCPVDGEEAPAVCWPGPVSRADRWTVRPLPLCVTGRAKHPLVALPTSEDLFVHANDLFFGASRCPPRSLSASKSMIREGGFSPRACIGASSLASAARSVTPVEIRNAVMLLKLPTPDACQSSPIVPMKADRIKVTRLVRAREAQGWTTWWDRESVPGTLWDQNNCQGAECSLYDCCLEQRIDQF
jgi:hypothetical protein